MNTDLLVIKTHILSSIASFKRTRRGKEGLPTKQLQSLVTGHCQHKCEVSKGYCSSWVSDQGLTKLFILQTYWKMFNLRKIWEEYCTFNIVAKFIPRQLCWKIIIQSFKSNSTVILCLLSIVQQNYWLLTQNWWLRSTCFDKRGKCTVKRLTVKF